eukprot:CAMPEP_0183300230 /NCGR_PEP_ID=MMETSP0160_2-20130417/6732_1 /TAXON_ID=2839 ORGANISM="Odontella Sinensis, Strain Grunow 1884" /NCGR_SAMPLE_ID=MMETSP0160_2 /ASSEMBLY_ACC=CAM_ASM_000250 /LENGTH=80 /DNA_ID=CAMNT_0025462617 /DNA_START=23 /DNA_END=261 /DNA_ORIENTATION=+
MLQLGWLIPPSATLLAGSDPSRTALAAPPTTRPASLAARSAIFLAQSVAFPETSRAVSVPLSTALWHWSSSDCLAPAPPP